MKEWKTVGLGKVAQFVRGLTFKPSDVVPVGTEGSVACMRTKNVQDALDIADVWAIPKGLVKRDEQYLTEGDTLVSSANSWNLVGKCCWVHDLPWRSTFGGFVSVLRAQSADLSPRFLYRWFSSGPVQATVRSFGNQTTNISNLNIELCLGMRVPLPPLDQQLRIVEILDQADALRAKRRAALAQVDGLTQAIFLEMFGDPVTNPRQWKAIGLRDLLAVPLRNGVSPSKSGKVVAKVLTLSAVTGDEFDPAAFKTSTFETHPPEDQSVDDADFLICRGNGNAGLVGKGYFPTSRMRDVTFPDTMIAARVDQERMEPRFVESVWNSRAVRRQIEAMARTTNGTFKINQAALERVELMLPPRDLQRAFARRAAAVEKLKASHRASLAQLDSLFASLQHRAFRGEL